MEILFFILLGVLLGTYGLAWMHVVVNKYQLWNISVCWKAHRLHHRQMEDEEHIQRNKYDMLTYSIIRTFNYFKNPLHWGYGDLLGFGLCLFFSKLLISIILGIFISENISYLQHTMDGYPIDFTNKLDNWLGLNQGLHAQHHGYEVKYSVNTQIHLGLLAVYIWWMVCLFLYPVLILNPLKSNNSGVYQYNLFRNLANYKAANGISFEKLIYRSASIFDHPIILIQYTQLIFGFNTNPQDPNLSHDISDIRNVYLFKDLPLEGVKWFNGKIVEGHHRYSAQKKLIKGS